MWYVKVLPYYHEGLDEYGTREFVNELDIKECRLVQTATGRCCIRFVAHIIWWCWSWFNEWYTRFSGIEGQVNESLEVMRSLFLKLEWPDHFYNHIVTRLEFQQIFFGNLILMWMKENIDSDVLIHKLSNVYHPCLKYPNISCFKSQNIVALIHFDIPNSLCKINHFCFQ